MKCSSSSPPRYVAQIYTRRGNSFLLFLLFSALRRRRLQDAKTIDEIDVSKIKKLVVIDSTWQKAKTILRDERFAITDLLFILYSLLLLERWDRSVLLLIIIII
jgi:hypothetical protein